QTRRYGRLGGDDRVVTVIPSLVQRSESTQPLIRRDLPCTDAASVEGVAFVAASQSHHRTPDEAAWEAEIAVSKRAVALHYLRTVVAQPSAESQRIHRTRLAQTVVHDAGWRWIREANGIDADADAHAGKRWIVHRSGPTEVRVVDAIGAAVVQVEAA